MRTNIKFSLALLLLLTIGASITLAQDETVAKTFSIGDAAAKKSFTLKLPKSWEEQPVSNNLRLAQYRVKSKAEPAETAELSVFPPFGGTVAANIDRQIATFQADGRKLVVKKGASEQGEYVIADLTGTYNRPVGPPVQQKTEAVAGQRMLYVILTLKDGGNVFLKMTGPEKLVADSAAALRASFGGDAAKEQDHKPQ